MRRTGRTAVPLALALAGTSCGQAPLVRSTPAIQVALRSAPANAQLMLLYDDAGVEPLAVGPGRAVWHIVDCTVSDSRCSTEATRLDFNLHPTGFRTIQVRLFNGRGNPIIGGVRWNGVLPARVSLRCDMAKAPASACRIETIDA